MEDMIIRKRHTWRDMAAAVLLCAGLASCSQDDIPGNPQGEPLPGGEYPLMLTASVDGIRSRAAGKDAWADGDEIGVRIGTDGAAGCYKLNADGTVKEAVTPVYWQNSASATVTAWWPYANKNGVYISDQSNGYAAYDFLTATAENQNYQTPVTLNFKHQMAKVKYTLQAGTGITADELATATVSVNGYYRLSFSQGTLKPYSTGNSWITTYATSSTEGEALLFPQNMAGKQFIRVRINNTFCYYTPKAGENVGNLVAGKAYTYTITVSAYGIEVKAVTGGTWSDGGSEPAGILVAEYTADDVKPGDYLYTDGTTSDGGLRARFSNGFVKTETPKPTPQTGKTVSGIVFWTPSETDLTDTDRKTPARLGDDNIMAAGFPGCTGGLAVALKDGYSGGDGRLSWQASAMDLSFFESVAATFQNSDNFTHEKRTDFCSIASGTGETDGINYIRGYQNTQVLLAYNTYRTNSKYHVNPVTHLSSFGESNPAPQGSTGWFLPSAKEWHILCCGDVDNVGGVSATGMTRILDLVNASLSAARGKKFASDYPYWSSTELVDNIYFAFAMNLNTAGVVSTSKASLYRVRYICAF